MAKNEDVVVFDNPGITRRRLLQMGATVALSHRALAQEASLVAAVGTPDPGTSDFVEPEVRRSVDGKLDTSLVARLSTNPLAGRTISGRTFEGKLTGPTLRFRPGDIVRVRYENQLPAGSPRNVTNLHTHGLFVSPAGNSDNVLYHLMPGNTFQHEYLIPESHVAGTFWYHPHHHGSVAPQVENGMSGAIIIEGGIDELPEIRAAKERLFVLQQLNSMEVTDRRALATTLEAIAGVNEKVTSVNGVHVPTLSMRPGEVQRWRFVAANSHDVLPVSIRRADAAPGAPPTMHQISWDGIPLRRVVEKREVRLAPGNRADVLVRAHEAGLYRLFKRGFPQLPFVDVPDSETLAWLRVEGEPMEMALPSDIPEKFSHPLIQDGEVEGEQRKLVFSVEGSPPKFMINGKEFDPDNPDPVVSLGAVEQWRLEASSEAGHPFHIHVNPFQVMESSDPDLDTNVWMDTVMIPPPEEKGAPNGYVVVRSRFQRYIGRFVLHCHILGHEDRGMMLLVEIAT